MSTSTGSSEFKHLTFQMLKYLIVAANTTAKYRHFLHHATTYSPQRVTQRGLLVSSHTLPYVHSIYHSYIISRTHF